MNIKLQVNKNFLPWFFLVLLSLIWGSSFILIKKSLDFYSPLQVGSLRIFFAYTVIFPITIYYFKKISTNSKEIRILFLCGLLGNLFPAYLFAIAQVHISSGFTGILNALTPLFTMVVATIVFKSRFKKGQMIGLLIGFLGLLFLGHFGKINYYAFFVILAAASYAININIIKAYLQHIKPLYIASGTLFFAGPIAIACLFSTDFISITLSNQESQKILGYLFILGAVGTSFAFIIFNKLLQMTTPVFASSVTYTIPIVAVFWGIMDEESFHFSHFLGMALIITGVYLSNR